MHVGEIKLLIVSEKVEKILLYKNMIITPYVCYISYNEDNTCRQYKMNVIHNLLNSVYHKTPQFII